MLMLGRGQAFCALIKGWTGGSSIRNGNFASDEAKPLIGCFDRMFCSLHTAILNAASCCRLSAKVDSIV
jgi:hypothetical protein